MDAVLPAGLEEGPVRISVEEHLRNNRIRPGVDLLLEVVHLEFERRVRADVNFFLAILLSDPTSSLLRGREFRLVVAHMNNGIGMALGVARDGQTEVVAMLSANKFH